MIEYNGLSVEERKRVYNNAFTWLHDHADHVYNLFDKDTPAVAPSGSDLFRPELWKGIHWQWYFTFLSNVDFNCSKCGAK